MRPASPFSLPWMFSADSGTVRIYPDFTRRLPVVDPDDHGLYTSLGCALENFVIAAAHHGFAAAVDYFPPDEPEELNRPGFLGDSLV